MGNSHQEAVLRGLEGLGALVFSTGFCPISASVPEVLPFLASLFTKGTLEYRTTALHRSVISQAHDPVGSTQLGSLPVEACFMKGVFEMKPSKPTILARTLGT